MAQSVGARLAELEGRQFDPRHSIDVCFDIPLFRVVEALNTRSIDRGRGVRGAHKFISVVVMSSATLIK